MDVLQKNWLVCGTRGKFDKAFVYSILDKILYTKRFYYHDWKPDLVIEGCCPDSADIWAEDWAQHNGITIQHHPSNSGNYLKRNIEMVKKATLVIAFWDGFSYGTAHTIAQSTMRSIPIVVYNLNDYQNKQAGGQL